MNATIRSAGPPISVVIPTYNRAKLVVRAVESVVAAVRDDDEIIVVDDGSTDNTIEMLSPYAARIRIVQGRHAGAGAARNLGIESATHRWVAFLDSDDEWDRDKIELQRPLLGRDDAIFVFTDFRAHMSDGSMRHEQIRTWSNDQRPWQEILGPARMYSTFASLPEGRSDFPVYTADLYEDLMNRSYLAAFTYIFRKDIGEPMPAFAPGVATWEDWQFFAQVAQRGKGLYMDCETATQHAHPGPRLTDADELDRINSRLVILKRVWGEDESFLGAHAQEYRQIMNSLEERRNFLLGRDLMLKRKFREARAVMRNAGEIPWKYRLLLRLPNVLVYGVTSILALLEYW